MPSRLAISEATTSSVRESMRTAETLTRMNPASVAVRLRLCGFGPVCGRFTSSVRREAITERFQVAVPETVSERYNVAPAQRVLSIRMSEDGEREPVLFRWGLIPHWAKDARIRRPHR